MIGAVTNGDVSRTVTITQPDPHDPYASVTTECDLRFSASIKIESD